jgi:hypothetical protein
MIDVTTHWYWALVIAGIAGAVGGLVYELISPHTKAELAQGKVELWGKGGGLWDFGSVATMIVGAVTAIAFLYFMEPKSVPENGEIKRYYDVIKLIAAGLLVGSGGPSVLKSLRERLLRVQLETMNEAAKRIAKDTKRASDPIKAEEAVKAMSSVLTAPGPK